MILSKDVVIVISSRPESKRIPRKAFRKIAGVTAIEHILTRLRLRKDKNADYFKTILAVPENCNEYDYLTENYNVEIFGGDEKSPLHRMADALTSCDYLPKYVVRITNDDIIIDFEEIENLIKKVVSSNSGYGITPQIIEGAGVEVIHVANIFNAANKNKAPIEHISYFVKGENNPVSSIVRSSPRKEIQRNYRLTMDYPEDVVVLETIMRNLGPFASNDEICRFIDLNPYLMECNALPLLSVYICARNAEKWIDDAIGSVPLAVCDGKYVDLIVVEDYSTDDTLKKILKWKDRIKTLIVNEKNEGLAESSNIALSHCRGKYSMRLDADDILNPHAVTSLIYQAETTMPSVLYSRYSEVDGAAMNILRENCDPKEKHHAGCALMRTSVLNEIKFKGGLRHWDGLELYNRIKQGGFQVDYSDVNAWFYRVHEKSMSSEINKEERNNVLKEILSSSTSTLEEGNNGSFHFK